MTTDPLKDLFADLREDTLPRVRPPGTGAVRRTTRQRRLAKVVGSAAAAILAVTGGVAIAAQGRQALPQPLPAASSAVPATPEERAQVALDRLIADAAGVPGRDVKSPVTAAFTHTEKFYVTPIVVTVACVGAGKATLVVKGGPETARIAVGCGDQPVPVRQEVELKGKALVFGLDDIEQADRSGFAFRVTSPRPDLRLPLAPGTYDEDNLHIRVGIGGEPGIKDSGTRTLSEIGPEFRWYSRYASSNFPTRPATLSMICRGPGGTVAMQYRRQKGAHTPDAGKVLAELSVPCEADPKIRKLVIKAALDRNIEIRMRYQGGADPVDGEMAYSLSYR
ncbi:hypothetical protein [Actinoplanes sp. G11-F43]|uniref:hypothetical protein n=1 Tax=Actinoplanes sp. G11-F43 TaxID=3424130 RepID=UPI003D346D0B